MVRNPRVLGEELTDLAAEFVGISGAAVVNEQWVAPLVQRVIPPSSDTVMAKVLNAATTAASALGLGWAIGKIDKRWGALAKRGGVMLAGVNLVSAVIPGVSLSGQIPIPQLPQLPAPPATNGNGTASAASATTWGI